MLRGFGHLVGDLDRAFDATIIDGAERAVLQPFRDRLIGGAIGTILHLCELKLG
jgi:hypothetical protein